MRIIVLAILLSPVFACAQNKGDLNDRRYYYISDSIRHITITNLPGQVVYDQAYKSIQEEIVVNNMPEGFYIVKINDHDHGYYYNKGVIIFRVLTGTDPATQLHVTW